MVPLILFVTVLNLIPLAAIAVSIWLVVSTLRSMRVHESAESSILSKDLA